ncbi:sigma-70 family RNA polymerase sigma factor [Mycobacterium sp. SMC-4]|uniref:sigma-70 family RNA polymerase sigma factor n=1 Tax=Mycobacterium sp. SMC-4 TaxID=2857059 RepID=UPI003D075ED9
MISTDVFEQARPRLLSVAYRMVGSVHDAEDAVQTAWLRTRSASSDDVDNPAAWLTTVVGSVCLDELRERRRRQMLAETLEHTEQAAAAADEDMLRREDVSRALLVLLTSLTPAQRVAYVLHDLFSVPFDDIATTLGTTPGAAKKHASRARARISPAASDHLSPNDERRHREIVEEFLRAARGGDTARMVTLLAPDCVRQADPELLPAGTAPTVRGAGAVAEETRSFLPRISVSTPLRLDGRIVDVIAPGGHPLAVIDIHTAHDVITTIAIRPVRPGDRFFPA